VKELRSLGDAQALVKEFRKYFQFDKNFMRSKNLFGMLKTAVVLAAKSAPVNQISLQGIAESDDPQVDTRLFISPENVTKAYESFMTGEKSTNPARSEQVQSAPSSKRKKKGGATTAVAGLVSARRQGEDLAVVNAKKFKLPFYFPGLVTNRSRYVNEPLRVYKLKDERNRKHNAYRLVLSVGENGEYWGVQGMDWRDPPILSNPDRIRKTKSGRELLLFYDGSKLIRVGWKTPRAAYYVSNTIGRKISNSRLIEVAASLRRLNS
jgi:hypothetical protein